MTRYSQARMLSRRPAGLDLDDQPGERLLDEVLGGLAVAARSQREGEQFALVGVVRGGDEIGRSRVRHDSTLCQGFEFTHGRNEHVHVT